MKKGLLFLALIGLILLIAGGAIFAYGLVKNKEDVITKTYEIEEAFENINIDVNTSNVELKLSTDAKTKVVVDETEKEPHKVEYKSETNSLVITKGDNRKFYEKAFSFNPDDDLRHNDMGTV